jgi:hypothetical protein
MLYKNHKKINFIDEPIYKEKKDEFEAFIKGKSNILFKTHDKIVINKTGYQEPDRNQTIPADATFVDSNGNVDTFIYLEQAAPILPNGENDYSKVKKPIIVTRVLNVPTTKKDLIFFLMYLSKASQTGRIFAFNEEAEDERKLKAISRASNVDYLLTGEFSPLTEENMRRIAKSFGIENVDKMTKAKLVLTLKAKVDEAEKIGDTSMNVAAFVEAMGNEELTAIKAMVQSAIDMNRIEYFDLDGTWYYCDETGAKVKKIVTTDMLIRNNKSKRENTLHNVFISDEVKRNDLACVLGYSTKAIDFSACNYGSLKKWCAANGLSGAGLQEELVTRATEYYLANYKLKPIDTTLLLVDNKKKEIAD